MEILLWAICILAFIGFIALMSIYPTLHDRISNVVWYNILDALVFAGMVLCVIVIGVIAPNLKIGG